MRGKLKGLLIVVGIVLASTSIASAARYESPNYTIDAGVGNSFGGDNESTSYKMTSSGGESIIGNGSGGSYILSQGYVAQLEKSLQLSIDSNELTFNEVIPGISQTLESQLSVLTDAPGYSLSLSQNSDLTKGSDTIPGVAATIPSPETWAEGTTTGLGFTVASSSATAPDAKWNSGNDYAALPSSSAGFYTRSGYSGGATDEVVVRYRLDVEPDQPSGQYENTVTYTGVMLP